MSHISSCQNDVISMCLESWCTYVSLLSACNLLTHATVLIPHRWNMSSGMLNCTW